MIDLDIHYTKDHSAEIAGDEYSLQELCSALKLCVGKGFDVELKTENTAVPARKTNSLTCISIVINDSVNQIRVSEDTLVIEGDEDFLLHLESNIPWDVEDTYSGLSYQMHYDSLSFGDYLDEQSIDLVLTKKRKN